MTASGVRHPGWKEAHAIPPGADRPARRGQEQESARWPAGPGLQGARLPRG